MTADPREQWAELLPVSADAKPDAVVAQLLRALPGDDFLPPAERVAAVNALAGAALPTGTDGTVERMLRAEVDALANNYWALSPGERLTTWAELSRRGAAAARLRELEPGLDVPVTRLTDPVAEELAALFRTLFVLPPRARAIRRNTWLLEHATDAGRWGSALAVVRRDSAPLVALEPSLRAALEPHFALARAALVEGATAAPLESAPVNTDRVIRKASASTPERVSSGSGWGGGGILSGGGVFIFLGIMLIRAIATLGGSANSSHPPAPARPNFQGYSLPTNPPPSVHEFTVAEVAEFQRYEREKAAGGAPEQPLAYAGWRLAGRPAGTRGAGNPFSKPKFTAADVAACLLYEQEKAQGNNVEPPPTYASWVLADRPSAPPSEPAPDERRVRIDGLQIAACQNYDRTGTGRRPVQFDDWVKAGKPTTGGVFTIPRSDPMP